MSKERVYDLSAVSPLIIFYVFAIVGFGFQIHGELTHASFSYQLLLSVCTKGLSALFAGLQIFLFIVRTLPIAKSKEWWPRVAAVIGANSALPLFWLPATAPSVLLSILSSLFIIVGTAGSIVIASKLGKSFSITPQARVLRTTGPYRFIRHPLYLAEQVAAFGISWQYLQPWSFLVFAIGLFFQFLRMRYEEQVLSEAFPTYPEYARRTARLIPGLY